MGKKARSFNGKYNLNEDFNGQDFCFNEGKWGGKGRNRFKDETIK